VGTATLLFYAALTLGAYGLGLMFFREKLNGAKIGALVMAMTGLAVIYELHLTSGQLLPAAATFAAGLMGATGVVLSKKLSGNYPEFQIILAYLAAMIVINPVMSFFLGEKLPDPAFSGAWLAQIGYAVSYLISNTAVVAGFKHLDPSIGALIGLLEVLFAAGFGVILFGEEITVQLLAGGSLILAAAGLPDIVSLMQRKYHGKPHDHKSGQPGG
jgi:drug/metabolite transporter (DMT)-like permease